MPTQAEVPLQNPGDFPATSPCFKQEQPPKTGLMEERAQHWRTLDYERLHLLNGALYFLNPKINI